MKLIIAQGNPGMEYSLTRHNVAWRIIDSFAAKRGASFQDKPKFLASLAECSHGNEKILLVKPLTYYNETGRSARMLCDFYKITLDDICVIHDELALPFGTIRTRRGGSNAGNNGIKSLISHLSSDDFWRIRIGIDTPLRNRMPDADFVLSRFSTKEQTALADNIFPEIIDMLDLFTQGKLNAQTTRIL